jgi:hypothetical protein
MLRQQSVAVTLAVAPQDLFLGQTLSLVARVLPATPGPVPTGSVRFDFFALTLIIGESDNVLGRPGGVPLGQATLDANGNAVLAVSAAQLESLTRVNTTFFGGEESAEFIARATYSGDSTYGSAAAQAGLPVVALTPSQHLVDRLYRDLLGRSAEPSALLAGGQLLDAGALSRIQLAQLVTNSDEYHAREVEDAYRTLLGRDADQPALNLLTGFLASGGTVAQLRTFLASSPEYFDRAGSTNDGFVQKLYADALFRDISAGELAAWRPLLATGVSRQVVARAVIGSPEARRDTVNRLYERYLGREADARGLAAFAVALAFGQREEIVVAALAGSDEYSARL